AIQHAIRYLDHGWSGRIAPVAGDADAMAEGGELIRGGFGDSTFEIEPAGRKLVAAEGAIKMFGLESRRLDGFLRRHAELDDVQQHLHERLVLIIAAGRR